jgi:hypothetical protein
MHLGKSILCSKNTMLRVFCAYALTPALQNLYGGLRGVVSEAMKYMLNPRRGGSGRPWLTLRGRLPPPYAIFKGIPDEPTPKSYAGMSFPDIFRYGAMRYIITLCMPLLTYDQYMDAMAYIDRFWYRAITSDPALAAGVSESDILAVGRLDISAKGL